MWVVRADWKGFNLGLKWEGDKTKLIRDEPRGSMSSLGVKSVIQLKCIFHLLTLNCTKHSATCPQSYGDKPRTPKEIKAERETPEDYVRGIKVCFSRTAEVPLNRCTQHGQQTGGAGRQAVFFLLLLKLGWIPWQECGYWWLQAVQNKQGRKERQRDWPPSTSSSELSVESPPWSTDTSKSKASG